MPDFYRQAWQSPALSLSDRRLRLIHILLGCVNFPRCGDGGFPPWLLFHGLLAFWTIRSSPGVSRKSTSGTSSRSCRHAAGRAAAIPTTTGRSASWTSITRHPPRPSAGLRRRPLVKNKHLIFWLPLSPAGASTARRRATSSATRAMPSAVALTLAGLFIGYCRPGRLPKLAAALLLFTPATWFVLARAWTEPSGHNGSWPRRIFRACRNLRWLLPLALGLLLACKQYLVLAIPLVPSCWSRISTGDRKRAAAPGSDYCSAHRDRRPRHPAIGVVGYLGARRSLLHDHRADEGPLSLGCAQLPCLDLLPRPFQIHDVDFLVGRGGAADDSAGRCAKPAAALPVSRTALAAVRSLAFIAFNKQAFCNYLLFS